MKYTILLMLTLGHAPACIGAAARNTPPEDGSAPVHRAVSISAADFEMLARSLSHALGDPREIYIRAAAEMAEKERERERERAAAVALKRATPEGYRSWLLGSEAAEESATSFSDYPADGLGVDDSGNPLLAESEAYRREIIYRAYQAAQERKARENEEAKKRWLIYTAWQRAQGRTASPPAG